MHLLQGTGAQEYDQYSDEDSVKSNEESVAGSSGSSSDDDDASLTWNERESDIFRDIDSPQNPLPEPSRSSSSIQWLTSLVQWFLYFILLWQAICKISDSGLEWLLHFMSQFFHVLGTACNSEYLSRMALMFPTSLYLLRKFVVLDRDDFTKLAVCPKCDTLYRLDRCTTRVGNRIASAICTNKKFKKGRSKECGTLLARKVILSDGKTCFYPFKLYCFNSVINELEAILTRPGVPEMCEQWRECSSEDDLMADVYDGLIWKDVLKYGDSDFLSAPRNLAFAINVDWFQPFKRRKDRSVGVIYLVILNLPREERYKWENIIVASIIPEMSKEPRSLNSFLQPIVDELKVLWKGVRLKTSQSRVELTYRAAILFASADLPAVRKLCGFKGFSAHRGCSKCFKYFPGSFGQKTDYSGFDRTQWPPRQNFIYRQHAAHVRRASTQTKHEKLAKKYGVYYSCLLQLEYFDAVRFTAIDPMHNLFLGTAKHIFKLWIKTEVLNKKDLHTLEERIHSVDVSTGIGRLPHKIASNYGSYTAAQWKNWTLIYSMYCLNGLLPEAHLRCWQTFVLACQYLSAPVVSKSDITRADLLFVKFGERFERLFGKKAVTPNIHLHCHLKECMHDLGPIHVFWCFSFERFNGILGATPLNGRSIEVQLMRKLLVERFVWNVEFPQEFIDTYLPFFNQTRNGCGDVANFSAINAIQLLNSARVNRLEDIPWSHFSLVGFPTSYKHIALEKEEMHLLVGCYQALYPEEGISVACLQSVARKYAYILLGSEKFGSKMDCRSLRSARVMAS